MFIENLLTPFIVITVNLQPGSVRLRPPVSESLSLLKMDQLRKFAQYLISDLPEQILPVAQNILDALQSQKLSGMRL